MLALYLRTTTSLCIFAEKMKMVTPAFYAIVFQYEVHVTSLHYYNKLARNYDRVTFELARNGSSVVFPR